MGSVLSLFNFFFFLILAFSYIYFPYIMASLSLVLGGINYLFQGGS